MLNHFKVEGRQGAYSQSIDLYSFDALDAMDMFSNDYPGYDIERVSIVKQGGWECVYGCDFISSLNVQAH